MFCGYNNRTDTAICVTDHGVPVPIRNGGKTTFKVVISSVEIVLYFGGLNKGESDPRSHSALPDSRVISSMMNNQH